MGHGNMGWLILSMICGIMDVKETSSHGRSYRGSNRRHTKTNKVEQRRRHNELAKISRKRNR